MLKDITRYMQTFYKYNSRRIPRLLVAFILCFIIESIGLAYPFITKYLIDEVIGKSRAELLIVVLLVGLGCILLSILLSISSGLIFIKSFKYAGVLLKLDIMKRLHQAQMQFFTKMPSGQISFRLSYDATIIEESWVSLCSVVPINIVLCFAVLILVTISPTITLVMFIIILCQCSITIIFHKRLLFFADKCKSLSQEIAGYTVEQFRNIELVKTLTTEKSEQKKFVKKLHILSKTTVSSYLLNTTAQILSGMVGQACIFYLLWYGGKAVISNDITLGTLMAFLMFSGIMARPIYILTAWLLGWQNVRNSHNRILEYLTLQSESNNVDNVFIVKPLSGNIKIEDICFSYNSVPILNHVNLSINSHQILALTGKSGAGKTTLCRMIIRLYNPDYGKILFDGEDVRNYSLKTLRKSILLMLQNTHMFSGTLWDNLTYGMNNASPKMVEKALVMAAADFVFSLPNGYNTWIGEGGTNLSAGEMQRITIARAFLLSPKVVIFDETTAAVDEITEEVIGKSLKILKNNSTIIIIAHRRTTLLHADKIAFMSEGSILKTLSPSEI